MDYTPGQRTRMAEVTTHVRTETSSGPDFCQPCSEAIGDWVPWPCPGFQETGETFTEAEELGLVVVGTITRLTRERDRARALAARLEQDLSKVQELLTAALEGWPETSWAADGHRRSILEDALKAATDPGEMP